MQTPAISSSTCTAHHVNVPGDQTYSSQSQPSLNHDHGRQLLLCYEQTAKNRRSRGLLAQTLLNPPSIHRPISSLQSIRRHYETARQQGRLHAAALMMMWAMLHTTSGYLWSAAQLPDNWSINAHRQCKPVDIVGLESHVWRGMAPRVLRMECTAMA